MIIDQKFSELTDEQLEERIQKLTKIVFSNNTNLSQQAIPILKALYEHQNERNSQKLEEHLEKSGMNLDEVINIG